MDFLKEKAKLFRAADRDEKLCYVLMGSIFLPYIITAIVLLSALVYLLAKKECRDKIIGAKAIKWFGVFCIPLLLSPILRLHWLGLAAAVGVAGILLVGIWISGVMRKKIFENCLDIAVIMSFPAALTCFTQKLVSFFTMPGQDLRTYSVFFNPNYYGAMIELLVLVCLYKMFSKPDTKAKVFYFATILVNLAALYIADSFSAWAAVGASIGIYLLITKRYKALVACCIAGVAAICMILMFPDILPRMSYVDQTFMMRYYIWQNAFDHFVENPILGLGTLGYWTFSQGELNPLAIQPHAHNIVLDVMLNYGLVGTVAFFGFFFKQYGSRLKGLMRSQSKPIGLFLIAVVTAVLVHGINDVTLLWHQTGLFFLFLLSGACVREAEQEQEETAALPLRLSCVIKKGLAGLDGAARIRKEVFMKEQGFVGEFDEIDAEAYHLVLYDKNQPIATGRTFFDEKTETYTIGRVAVVREYRDHHIGSVVISELERKIKDLGGTDARLSAQIQAKGFYEKLGYRAQGTGYYDEHCPHIDMVKSLS